MTVVISRSDEARAERFGYVCRRCLNCCHEKLIQLNPYEVARLAANRGVSTAEFAERFTLDGAGQVLLQVGDDGACVFLGEEGCTVHPDRPLVCRLYPLGRHVAHDGTETFSRVTPHPLSAGEITDQGTIAGFLEAQGAAPFMAAADAYLAWVRGAVAALPGAVEALQPERRGQPSDLFDMDGAIAEHCHSTGEAEPVDVDSRLQLHLAILHGRLAELGGTTDE